MAKIKTFAIIFLLIAITAFSVFAYLTSNNLKIRADKLIKEDKLEEALLLYKEAYSVFPLRRGILDDIQAANLLLASKLEYGKIEQIFAEIQEVPPINQIQMAPKEGELFVPILMYHHIRDNPKPADPVWAALNVRADQLDAQLMFLSSHNFHTITLDDLNQALNNKKSLPENPVVLTFDDGYRNFYENAYPLLKKYKMKAIEFVITDTPGTAYLTWDQIVEMDKSGLIEFGAHTQHHPNLPDLSNSLIEKEITASKSDLEQHLGKPTRWFAYPYGSYNNFIVKTVQNAGYEGAVSVNYSPIQSKDKIFLLPRMMVDGRFTLDEFARRISK